MTFVEWLMSRVDKLSRNNKRVLLRELKLNLVEFQRCIAQQIRNSWWREYFVDNWGYAMSINSEEAASEFASQLREKFAQELEAIPA